MVTESEIEIIPRQLLFGDPVKAEPRISPDGSKLSYLATHNGVQNVWVRDIETGEEKPVTFDTDRGVQEYFWIHDNKHIMYLKDVDGDAKDHLQLVDLISGDDRDLTPYPGVRVEFIEHNKEHPNEMLIGMNLSNPDLFDAYRLNIDTGFIDLVAVNPGSGIEWLSDSNLNPKIVLSTTDEGGLELLTRENVLTEWKLIESWNLEDSLSVEPLYLSKDGNVVYILDSKDSNTTRLVSLDLLTGTKEVLAEDPHYDITHVLSDLETRTSKAVRFARDRTEWTALDNSFQDDFDALVNLDPGDFLLIDQENVKNTWLVGDTWLVGYTNDTSSVRFYAYDRKSQTGSFLFEHQPELNNYTLASMRPISFEAQDGLEIHGYLTMPVNKQEEKVPLVLYVHGGPWYRDSWGYDPVAQWLANRGYACLQINYRGSTGYGKDFTNAGDKEWAGKMHNDLVDGIEWAIDQGNVDSEKIAIYGRSYGGFAALTGATFTPDLFSCAIDVCGPSNLKTFTENLTDFRSPWRPKVTLRQKKIFYILAHHFLKLIK